MERNQLFALFGNPVSHSNSALMHNTVFKELGINARYHAICVERTVNIVHLMEILNIRGASITIPFKTSIVEHIDEITESAQRIGAVNTIVRSEGRLKGDNTDWIGIVSAIQESTEIKGRTFIIQGSGGAARAAVFGVMNEGGVPVVTSRTTRNGEKLAQDFGCEYRPLEELENIATDFLINATPVGMYPDVEKSPVKKEALGKFKWVMDVVYNPLKTRLLMDAEEAGCSIISGLSMFVNQGAEQLKIWMGIQPPRELMTKVVMENLKNERN
ncbi:MAG TPA: shikimate dehydrogenase [Desulfobacteraceae bacterium]|nr:shikimate dehydrogenase [Desulfobacteraceae bacterium]